MVPISFYERAVDEVARDLIGCRLASRFVDEHVSGRIVEVEAYGMEEDAFYGRHIRPTESGGIATSLTAGVLHGPRGAAFVYSVFFGNWLLNVVAGPPGYLGCVLVRAVEPLGGIETMRRRRNSEDRDERLAAGPGRLTKAFSMDGSLNGHPLQSDPLTILPPDAGSNPIIQSGPRIGVKRARALRWRFFDATSRSLSRPAGYIADSSGSP